jgi:hypothetical protein
MRGPKKKKKPTKRFGNALDKAATTTTPTEALIYLWRQKKEHVTMPAMWSQLDKEWWSVNGINYWVTCADVDEAPQSKNEWKQQQQIVDV